MENGFIAKPCNFQGEPGYMLEQYYNGRVVCSQFLPESSFDYFCKVAGINPVIEEQAERIRLFLMHLDNLPHKAYYKAQIAPFMPQAYIYMSNS